MSEIVLFKTNGTGLWSNTKKTVQILNMELKYWPDDWLDENYDEFFGELRVQFATTGDYRWSIYQDGLIYTDKLFLSDLRTFLDRHGLPGDDVTYSEQGMQGDNYVSLDVGDQFVKAWLAKFGGKFSEKFD